MSELFKTVLILSAFGSVLTALLLVIKPITVKKFPASWQYYVWLAVLISMIVPVFKLIPKEKAEELTFIPQNEVVSIDKPLQFEENTQTLNTDNVIIDNKEIEPPRKDKNLFELFSYVWIVGFLLYLVIVVGSYIVYIIRKRQKTVAVVGNSVFDEVKDELKIKRNIKIRKSEKQESPMLVGVLFPVIYIPCGEISDEQLRMVFLHELTHFKRGDLIFKWLSIFVNAVHWFNPFAYFLCANVSMSCEISCDMAVTKNMSDTEQKTYMRTILDLAR